MSQEIEQLKAELADARNTIEEYKEAFDLLIEQNNTKSIKIDADYDVINNLETKLTSFKEYSAVITIYAMFLTYILFIK